MQTNTRGRLVLLPLLQKRGRLVLQTRGRLVLQTRGRLVLQTFTKTKMSYKDVGTGCLRGRLVLPRCRNSFVLYICQARPPTTRKARPPNTRKARPPNAPSFPNFYQNENVLHGCRHRMSEGKARPPTMSEQLCSLHLAGSSS